MKHSLQLFILRYQVARKCWHIDPTQRGNFERIVEEIEELLEDKSEYVSFPVNEDYYKFFPKKVADPSKGPTPRPRKGDEYLEPINVHKHSGFIIDCGIDTFRKDANQSINELNFVTHN